MSLFNMPTQQQLGQQYLEGMLTTPQQLGAQGLLQQVVSLGGNAGSMLGYGVGRMMGGMTADEVRAKGIDDAMRTVQGLGLTSDAEMYGALSKELANKGLTQDALKARNAGLEAKKAEETMRINQERLVLAQQEGQRQQAQEERAAALHPGALKIQAQQLVKLEDDNKTLGQKIGEAEKALYEARDSGASQPDIQIAYEKLKELQQRKEKVTVDIEESRAKILYYGQMGQAAVDRAKADQARAAAAANVESFTKTEMMKDLMGNSIPIGKYSHKLNKFQSNDGYIFNTRKELEDYYTTQQKIKADAAKGGESKKVKEGAPSLSELRGGTVSSIQTTIPVDKIKTQPIGPATPQSWIEESALAGNKRAQAYLVQQAERRRIQEETSIHFPQ